MNNPYDAGNRQATTVGTALKQQGINRRTFLQYCTSIASLMALPAGAAEQLATALAKARRPSVIWLSFQECTGCTEALTRSHSPSLESLILDMISLDYHHTLQAASGEAAEAAREAAMKENAGKYLVVVDGSVPMGNPGYSTIAGIANVDVLRETVRDAAAVLAVGTCAAYGGLPAAQPNPTGAVAISDLIRDKPIVNIPGCPPIPTVMTGVIAHYLAFGALPELDALGRPKAFYGETIHDRCYRRPFYDQGKFAETFDDEAARKGWCLFKLGCKGPATFANCPTQMFNDGTQWPIGVGHGCVGCAEPDFWDTMTPVYDRLPRIAGMDAATTADRIGTIAAGALATGLVVHGSLKIAQHRKHGINQPDTKSEEISA